MAFQKEMLIFPRTIEFADAVIDDLTYVALTLTDPEDGKTVTAFFSPAFIGEQTPYLQGALDHLKGKGLVRN